MIRIFAALMAIMIAPALASANNIPVKIQEVETHFETKIWLIEDNSLPIVTFKIAFKNAGSAYEKSAKSGTAFLLSNMLDKGAGKYNNLELKKELEERAIYINFNVDKDNFYINLTSLKEHSEKAFEILGLILTKPRFDFATFNRVKNQVATSISKKMEKPQYIADLNWIKYAFKGHPYSRPTRGYPETIKKISITDLKVFMKKNFSLSNAVMSAVGDISEAELQKLYSDYLGAIPITPKIALKKSSPGIVKITKLPAGKTIKIPKDIPQSVAIFGQESLSYDDPDYFTAYVTNYILGGGGFESRLMDEIREKKGLAYSVYSYMTSLSYVDILKGSVGTRAEKMNKSLEILRQEFAKIRANGVSENELESAKKYLIGSFPLKLDSNQNLIDFITFIQLEDLGKDFIKKRAELIKSVTLDDIKRVANKTLNPNNLIIVVVGKDN